MFSKHNLNKNAYQLNGSLKRRGYDWWWHSFTATNEKTGEAVPFFVEFFIINPGLKQDKPVLGQEESNKEKGVKPSYLMIKCGCWTKDKKVQLHRFFSLNDVKIKKGPGIEIEADNCYLSETHLKGTVLVDTKMAKKKEYMCDSGKMEFDLNLEKIIPYNVGYGTSALFRFIKAFQMYWHVEGMKTLYEGTILLNGENYIVEKEKSFGYADKNFGRGFTSPWVWLSSNNLVSNITNTRLNNSAFDIGGGRPKIYLIPFRRKLLGGFYYEGKEYEFNFSKFWTGSKTKFDFKEDEEKVYWHVEQETFKNKMIIDVSCLKEDMLFVNYEDPDGQKRHNHLFNGGNGKGNIKLYRKKKGKLILIDDVHAENIGCEYGEFDK